MLVPGLFGVQEELQDVFVTRPVPLCVLLSPDCDIRREGSVLPGSGSGSGSVLLLPAHPEEHHQADLLLQPSRQSLGIRLPEMSLLRFRSVSRETAGLCLGCFFWLNWSFNSELWNKWLKTSVSLKVCEDDLRLCLWSPQWPSRRSVRPVLVTSTQLQPCSSTRESPSSWATTGLCW